MSEMNPEDAQEQWTAMIEEMNQTVASSVERNMETQAAFVESWLGAVEDATPEEAAMGDATAGYERASEVWMEAAERMNTKVADAAEGEEVPIEEFRDIWLRSANEAFSEVMGTTAFAAGTGELLGNAMETQQEADDLSQDTLETLGFATREDIDEVAERLVELERRQHEVAKKLDRLLEE